LAAFSVPLLAFAKYANMEYKKYWKNLRNNLITQHGVLGYTGMGLVCLNLILGFASKTKTDTNGAANIVAHIHSFTCELATLISGKNWYEDKTTILIVVNLYWIPVELCSGSNNNISRSSVFYCNLQCSWSRYSLDSMVFVLQRVDVCMLSSFLYHRTVIILETLKIHCNFKHSFLL